MASCRSTLQYALSVLTEQDIPVRDDFLDMLYEIRNRRDITVKYLELNKHKTTPNQRTDVLLSYLKKKELTIYDIFTSSEKKTPRQVHKDEFMDTLKVQAYNSSYSLYKMW